MLPEEKLDDDQSSFEEPLFPERPYGFNKAHQVDLKYVKDHRGKKYVFLSMLDAGTVHHQAVMCTPRRSEYMCKWRLRLPFSGSRQCRQGRNLLVTPHLSSLRILPLPGHIWKIFEKVLGPSQTSHKLFPTVSPHLPESHLWSWCFVLWGSRRRGLIGAILKTTVTLGITQLILKILVRDWSLKCQLTRGHPHVLF